MESWKSVAVVVAVLALLTAGASIAYGSRMRGVAQAHIELARQDSIVKDSLQEEARGLRELADIQQAELVAQDRRAQLQRVRDSVELADLRTEQVGAREMTLVAMRELQDLPPEVMRVVQPVLDLLEFRIANLEDQVVEVEGQRDMERERADGALTTATTWMESSLGYERALNASNAENGNLRAAVEALDQAASVGIGLRLKLGWWMLPVGFGIGYGVASR